MRRLEKEAARLQGLLNAAGIDSGRHSMTGMRKEMSRLKDVIARQAEELKELKAENERLRSARDTHAKARFGRKSEKQKKKKSGSGRKRGQQADTPGHGPTPRSDMDRKSEVHDPPEEERVCPCCGLPYVKNGSHDSEFIEGRGQGAYPHHPPQPLAAQLHLCVGAEGGCGAPGSPAVPSYALRDQLLGLFPVRVLRLPPPAEPGRGMDARAGAARLARDPGLQHPQDDAGVRAAVAGDPRPPESGPGASRRRDRLAGPVPQGHPRHQPGLAVVRGLRDAVWFHVDARRNAEAAAKLFAGVGAGTILVCDAYSAYKKLARVLGGILILAWCWAHVRRKFIEAAAGNDALEKWADRWLDRIGKVYHLNAVRLKHYNPDVGMDQQSRKFGIAHRRVKRAVDRLFALAEKERAGPAGFGPASEGAQLAAEASRRALRVRRQARRAHGQQPVRADASWSRDRAEALVRLRQPERGPVLCHDVRDHRDPADERDRCPQVARRLALGLRGQRRPAAG